MVVNGSVSVWRSVTSAVPQVSAVTVAVLCNDIDSGIECSLSKLVDNTKLCGSVDMPKGWMPFGEDLDRLKQWVQV